MGRHRGKVMLVVGLALIASACSSSGGGSGGGGSGTGGGSATSAPPAGGGTTATIVAQGFAFDPATVTLSAGKVTLTVTNEDGTEHTFTLDDGSSSTNLDPGKTVTIDLDLSKTVGWHCNIHPSMTGTLEVA